MCLDCIERAASEGQDNVSSARVVEISDAGHGTWTSYRMSPGDTFHGTLSSGGDRDWVAITLTEGETYEIELSGAASGGGTLSDPYLRLYNGQGSLIRSDDDSGPGYDSAITFTATATGTYYIGAGSYSDNYSGSYTISTGLDEPAPHGSLNDLAGYLTDGYWEDSNRSRRSFDTSESNVITVNLTGLTAEGRQLARWALEAWEMVAGIEFSEITGSADITFTDDESYATAYSTSEVTNGVITSSIVNVSLPWLTEFGTSIDSYSLQTYIHEVGHALGLGHQGDYNGTATYGSSEEFSNDSWQLSIMSYFSQTENTSVDASYASLLTPMMADILAIQELYGAPGSGSATAGDTVWGPGSSLPGVLGDLFGNRSNYEGEPVAFTIYDQSGTDTLDLSSIDTASRVDLRQGHFSDAGGLIGNIGIARGTVVENLITGAGNDTVTGNSAANDIRTQAGDDTVRAMGGSDRLDGGDGNDQLFGNTGNDHLSGGAGRDRLVGGGGNDRLFGGGQIDRLNGGNANDRLYGGAGRDRLDGGSGRDLLNGGAGDDILTGGAGNDVFVFGSSHGHDRILDFTAGQSADRINFSRLSGFDGFGDVLADAVETADGVRISTGANSSVLLEDVQLSSLSADDFIF
ncbi:M10 family metallopeptidase C-terminal domain-containing protein [Leisingera aquaemixtae]|uniref:M10 family metallopeptidase C-terminal domain-containing protein n=1 Tax=Leisingera aquaemixtae TaxID=1396826 RepID=UPI001C943E32|nr:M10 family metallopeptidase C-terminal domain-containing protein [Leisingera aquaemixtae]MBY6066190.1 M10 family metallopeptidase C-terminal domain-containing protein [Leisingera aquaemixtae]